MRSVVRGVLVSLETGSVACQLVEKYPGDFRWRCGACNLGWVKPFEGDICTVCPSQVVTIIRDEDEKARNQRSTETKLRSLMNQLEQIQGRGKTRNMILWEGIRERKELEGPDKDRWLALREEAESNANGDGWIALYSVPDSAVLTKRENTVRTLAFNDASNLRKQPVITAPFRPQPAEAPQLENLVPLGKRKIILSD